MKTFKQIYESKDPRKTLLKGLSTWGKEKHWKDTPFMKWKESHLADWVNYVREAENPNDTRRLPTGTGYTDSPLVPRFSPDSFRTVNYIPMLRRMAHSGYSLSDTVDILTKAYISLEKEDIENGYKYLLGDD